MGKEKPAPATKETHKEAPDAWRKDPDRFSKADASGQSYQSRIENGLRSLAAGLEKIPAQTLDGHKPDSAQAKDFRKALADNLEEKKQPSSDDYLTKNIAAARQHTANLSQKLLSPSVEPQLATAPTKLNQAKNQVMQNYLAQMQTLSPKELESRQTAELDSALESDEVLVAAHNLTTDQNIDKFPNSTAGNQAKENAKAIVRKSFEDKHEAQTKEVNKQHAQLDQQLKAFVSNSPEVQQWKDALSEKGTQGFLQSLKNTALTAMGHGEAVEAQLAAARREVQQELQRYGHFRPGDVVKIGGPARGVTFKSSPGRITCSHDVFGIGNSKAAGEAYAKMLLADPNFDITQKNGQQVMEGVHFKPLDNNPKTAEKWRKVLFEAQKYLAVEKGIKLDFSEGMNPPQTPAEHKELAAALRAREAQGQKHVGPATEIIEDKEHKEKTQQKGAEVGQGELPSDKPTEDSQAEINENNFLRFMTLLEGQLKTLNKLVADNVANPKAITLQQVLDAKAPFASEINTIVKTLRVTPTQKQEADALFQKIIATTDDIAKNSALGKEAFDKEYRVLKNPTQTLNYDNKDSLSNPGSGPPNVPPGDSRNLAQKGNKAPHTHKQANNLQKPPGQIPTAGSTPLTKKEQEAKERAQQEGEKPGKESAQSQGGAPGLSN